MTPVVHLYDHYLGKTPGDLHKKWGDLKENQWLLDTTMEQISELVHTQKVAAQEAGYPNVTTEKRAPEFKVPGGSGRYRAKENSAYIDTKIPYRAYLDLGKNLPTAQNSDELEAQLERISGMEDRTYLQQNYLAQKVYARYLMNQVAVRGGSDAMSDKLYYPARIRVTGTGSFKGQEYHEDWGEERFHNYEDSAQALLYWDAKEGNQYLPPWASADDDGKLMPSFRASTWASTMWSAQKTLKLSPAEHEPHEQLRARQAVRVQPGRCARAEGAGHPLAHGLAAEEPVGARES